MILESSHYSVLLFHCPSILLNRVCAMDIYFYSPFPLLLSQESLSFIKFLKNWCIFSHCDNREKWVSFLHGKITSRFGFGRILM